MSTFIPFTSDVLIAMAIFIPATGAQVANVAPRLNVPILFTDMPNEMNLHIWEFIEADHIRANKAIFNRVMHDLGCQTIHLRGAINRYSAKVPKDYHLMKISYNKLFLDWTIHHTIEWMMENGY